MYGKMQEIGFIKIILEMQKKKNKEITLQTVPWEEQSLAVKDGCAAWGGGPGGPLWGGDVSAQPWKKVSGGDIPVNCQVRG